MLSILTQKRENYGDHKIPCLFGHRGALCSKYFQICRNPKTLRQILQKWDGRMGYPCIVRTLESSLVVGCFEQGDETSVLYKETIYRRFFFVSRRHNPLWVCIHSPLEDF